MADTTHLQLPLMAAAQAQKHVTHNEALLRLDALVQMSVIDRDLTAPPANPADGDRYIPASGASGAWATWDLNIAWFVDGVWTKLAPREGWRVWVEDEDLQLIWDGAVWVESGVGDLSGPAQSAANEAALFDGATGKLLKRPGTSHVLIARGTTAQRPSGPSNGALRYNTDTGLVEYWNGARWTPINPMSPLILSTSGQAVGQGVTVFFGVNVHGSTAPNIALPIPFSGTVRNLAVLASGAPGSDESFTYTLQAAAPGGSMADTTLSVTMTNSNTGQDGLNSASATFGGRLAIKLTTSAAASIRTHAASVELYAN